MKNAQQEQIFLGIGSNLGHRSNQIQIALTHLANHQHIHIIGVSSLYETEPVGGPAQGNFLNCVAELKSTLKPVELFRFVKKVELSMGRVVVEKWGPRCIDLDILLFGQQVINMSEPSLNIPHPRMLERDFVVIPLLEITPSVEHPVVGNVLQYWSNGNSMNSIIEKYESHTLISSLEVT